MKLTDLIHTLYKQGLGEHLVLHLNKGQVILSHLTYEKGKLVFDNENYLKGFKPEHLRACWDNGTVGMVTQSSDHEWESLTFYGLEHCQIPEDLSSTRHGAMTATRNQFGDTLIDFKGSIYRGFQLMLESHYTPAIILKPLKATSGETGLVVADLRMIPMEIKLLQTIHDVVTKSIEIKDTLDIGDAGLSTAEFENLFGTYVSKN